MPLLMCPNDKAPMQTVDRSGVQFDMCPTCRGVWLDRGELDKIVERLHAEAGGGTEQAPPRDDRTHDQDRGREKTKPTSFIMDVFEGFGG